jgi:hypothetical protein
LKATVDEKGFVTVERPLASGRTMLQAALGKTSFKTKLFYVPNATTGSSGLLYATVIQANMVLASEYSTFAALFDEVKAHNVKIAFTASIGIANASTAAWCAIVWDDGDNTALASVAEALPYRRRAGPHSAMARGATTGSAPTGMVPHEFMEVSSGKLLGSVFPAESSGNPVAYPIRGDWITTSSSTAIVGFFKPFCEAVGSNTWAVRYILEYDVEYRFRS